MTKKRKRKTVISHNRCAHTPTRSLNISPLTKLAVSWLLLVLPSGQRVSSPRLPLRDKKIKPYALIFGTVRGPEISRYMGSK